MTAPAGGGETASSEYEERVETEGIGIRAQHEFHRALVAWAAGESGRIEVQVDGRVVDVVQNDLLIEVQTSSLSAIRTKLERLVEAHPVRLVHPLSTVKWLRCYDAAGENVISERRSPKRETFLDAFGQLVYITDLLQHPDFELQLLLVERREVRCADGNGSWRRKGVSIIGQELLAVTEARLFRSPDELAALLPPDLGHDFTVSDLAKAAHIRQQLAGRMAYTLHQVGALTRERRQGRAYVYSCRGAGEGR